MGACRVQVRGGGGKPVAQHPATKKRRWGLDLGVRQGCLGAFPEDRDCGWTVGLNWSLSFSGKSVCTERCVQAPRGRKTRLLTNACCGKDGHSATAGVRRDGRARSELAGCGPGAAPAPAGRHVHAWPELALGKVSSVRPWHTVRVAHHSGTGVSDRAVPGSAGLRPPDCSTSETEKAGRPAWRPGWKFAVAIHGAARSRPVLQARFSIVTFPSSILKPDFPGSCPSLSPLLTKK